MDKFGGNVDSDHSSEQDLARAPPSAGASPLVVEDAFISSCTKEIALLALTQENRKRKYGGPPPGWEGPAPPRGCKVFVEKIPRDMDEDALVPLFERAGRIYEFRLMMEFSGENRGYAFVTYTNREVAQRAIQMLDKHEIRAGKFISVCELDNDVGFQQAVRMSHGTRPPARGPLASSLGRPLTGALTGAVQDGAARPMTAIRGAGFTSALTRGSTFESRGPAPALEAKKEDLPEEKIKLQEKKVNELIEESCLAQSQGSLQLALEKAREAGRKDRALARQREQSGNADINLTYSVLLNLANQYTNNEMYTEALNTYQVLVTMFSEAGRLKVNMANIFLKQKNYPEAIKFYRMALDEISSAHKDMRIKIMRNIGVVFLHMGLYPDAINSFEHIMSECPNIKAGYNLILCFFATGDRDHMKTAFQKLISVPLKLISHSDDSTSNMVIEAIRNDALHQMERNLKVLAENYITTAAKLIAPAIESSFAVGFDWCVEMVKNSQYVELANDLEIHKAMTYLRQNDFSKAKETLKTLAKKASRVKSAAATNLSAIYFLEKDFEQADRYADLAMTADRYNPAALVNKGNAVFHQQDYEKAAEFYKKALWNDSSCTEALYNLGLTYERLSRLEEALDCFHKLHAIQRDCPEVMYQLASLFEQLDKRPQAIDWLRQMLSVVPTDAKALAKLGELYHCEGDKSQAYHYYFKSYRYFPSNMDVIEWLAVYHIETHFFEKAIQYFERATLIQPAEVKWQLMVASCFRRSGNYQKSLETYKGIHSRFPENVECLRFLVKMCTVMGLAEVQEYANKLKKQEKMRELREQRVKSGLEGSGKSRREGSAGSSEDVKTGAGPYPVQFGAGRGNYDSFRGNPSFQNKPRGNRGMRGDPRSIIEYRDLDAPDDLDFF